MVLEVVRRGVTPVETEMFGLTVPLYNNTPAPEDAVPIPKWVIVAEPLTQALKSMLAAGDTELAVTIHPPDVRATVARA